MAHPEPVAALWRRQLLPFLPSSLQRAVAGIPDALACQALELRIRLGRPLLLVTAAGEVALQPDGSPAGELRRALHPDRACVEAFFEHLSGGSLYAVEEQVRRGYLTLPGGHRVGLCGRAVLDAGGGLQALTELSGFNVRVARAVEGAGRRVLGRLLVGPPGRRRLASTLVLAPPGAGKTTLLRDLARLASAGVPEMGLAPCQVVVVDERSEIAGCWRGIPQHDVGPRTDVLDGCPKAEGVLWAVRALGPAVLVTDEVGTAADVEALLRACHSGASLVASAHADDLAGARRRRGLAQLLEQGAFQRAVVLSLRAGPGTVEQVEELQG
ncbi:MAG TPA: stage III sporulation protein AA [Limnochordales bacterium]